MQEATYARLLSDLDDVDFTNAVEEIALTDQWFPPPSRIREMAAASKTKRGALVQQEVVVMGAQPLVCPTCAGARWVALGGYDAPNIFPGDQGSRVQRCPDCTVNGEYAPGLEQRTIARHGGVPNPNSGQAVDADPSIPWHLPRREDGTPDMDALYRQSRILRGLDPDVDERPAGVAGFNTIGQLMRKELVRA